MVEPDSPSRIRRRRAEAWENFQAFINERDSSNWMFRGHANEEWQIKPKIGRVDKAEHDAFREYTIFDTFRRRARIHLGNVSFTNWEWLCLAQHHGLPTRLLDWTSNPLMAAFFAVADRCSPDTDAVIIAVKVRQSEVVDQDDEHDPFGVEREKFVVPNSVVPRIVAQRGFFTVHPDPEEAWDPPSKFTKDSVTIPADCRNFFRRRLFYRGIDASHAMADIDGLCETLRWQYERGIAVGGVSY
jgi:hypothetical protein